MNLLLSRLDEQQRRWYLAVESERFGYGADRILFEITGVDEKTIRRGAPGVGCLAGGPSGRPRSAAGWRPTTDEKKDLTIVATLQELVEPETAGDPMTGQIWVRSSLRSLRDRLEAVGHPVSAPTVARLLKDLRCTSTPRSAKPRRTTPTASSSLITSRCSAPRLPLLACRS